MTFAGLIQQVIEAACRGDGGGVAACFTPGGVYHDVFYGRFRGRDEIVRMIEGHFHAKAASSAGIFMSQWRQAAWAMRAMYSAIARG